MIFHSRRIAIIFAAIICMFGTKGVAQSGAQNPLKIYTDTYRPYINPVGETEGSAMRMVRMTVLNMERNPDFEYIDFGYGYFATRKSEEALSFPWLKTAEREKQILYSVPIYSTKMQIFYNIRFHPDGIAANELDGKIYGRVVNYSYGEDIDAMLAKAEAADLAKSYASDFAAIQALLSGDIDILPQLSSVLTASLNASFPNQNHLVRAVPDISTLFPNYVIAPKTRKGDALIKAFNKSYNELLEAGIINPETVEAALNVTAPSDVGEIVASEGFPVAIGVSRENRKNSFAIPPGTRVLILDWSDRIQAPSNADQLYKTMVDETLVLILNGPHIGKELLVKNMHLIIAP